MRDIAVTISASGKLWLSNRVLGYQGETGGTRLIINVESWHADGSTYGMTIMRDDGRGWTVFLGAVPDEGVISYVVNSYELGIEGCVRVQFLKNDGTHVNRSELAVMDALLSVLPSDPPADDMPAWYDLMMAAAHELGLTIQGAGTLYDAMVMEKEAAVAAKEAAETKAGEAAASAQAVEEALQLATEDESARKAAELLREGAETDRETAEGLREGAEVERETAEGQRDSAETAREAAESLRVAAEAARMGFVPKGAYNPANENKYGEWYTHEGGSYGYIWPEPSTGVPLSDTTHWQQIATMGGQDLVDAAVAARDAALGYKDAAALSASTATAQATLAQGYKDDAVTARDAAQGYKDDAAASRDAALGYKDATVVARDTAEGYRDEAQGYAEQLTDSATNIKNVGAVDGEDSTAAVQGAVDIGNDVLVPPGNFPITALTNILGVDFKGIGNLLLPKNLKANSNYAKPREPIMFGIEYLEHFHKGCIALWDTFTSSSTKMLCLLSGDSTTAGDGLTDSTYQLDDLLNKLSVNSGIPFCDFQNKGHSGYLSSDWVDTYLAQDLALTPDLYILRWGINDGKLGWISDYAFSNTFQDRVDAFVANLRSGLATIRASKTVDQLSIILMSPNSTSDYKGGRDELWHEAIIPAIKQAARDYQCCFINTYQIAQDSRNASGYMDATYTDDRHLHPLEVMNLWITSTMFDVIFPSAIRQKLSNNKLINEHSVNIIKLTTDLLGSYEFGITLSRVNDSGLDGALFTQRTADNVGLQIYSGYDPAAPVIKIRLGSTVAWSAWTALTTPEITNIGGSTLTKASTDLGSTYPKGLSMCRAITGFPRDGAVYTLYHTDGMILQFNIPYNYTTLQLSVRAGNETTWSPWVALAN